MPLSIDATMEDLRVEVARLQGEVAALSKDCKYLHWVAAAETALAQGLALQLVQDDAVDRDNLVARLRENALQISDAAAREWVQESIDRLAATLRRLDPAAPDRLN